MKGWFIAEGVKPQYAKIKIKMLNISDITSSKAIIEKRNGLISWKILSLIFLNLTLKRVIYIVVIEAYFYDLSTFIYVFLIKIEENVKSIKLMFISDSDQYIIILLEYLMFNSDPRKTVNKPIVHDTTNLSAGTQDGMFKLISMLHPESFD